MSPQEGTEIIWTRTPGGLLTYIPIGQKSTVYQRSLRSFRLSYRVEAMQRHKLQQSGVLVSVKAIPSVHTEPSTIPEPTAHSSWSTSSHPSAATPSILLSMSHEGVLIDDLWVRQLP
jgi:hypothetical protein